MEESLAVLLFPWAQVADPSDKQQLFQMEQKHLPQAISGYVEEAVSNFFLHWSKAI